MQLGWLKYADDGDLGAGDLPYLHTTTRLRE